MSGARNQSRENSMGIWEKGNRGIETRGDVDITASGFLRVPGSSTPVILLLHRTRPVQNKCDGLSVSFLHQINGEEALTVRRRNKAVAVVGEAGCGNTRGEQRHRGAGLER